MSQEPAVTTKLDGHGMADVPGQPTLVPCKYKTGRTLGQGTYAVVKEAVHLETGVHYAVKVINKSLMRGREYMVRNEIDVLRKISMGHPNVLSMVDFFETTHNLYLVTDLALGGELFDRICAKGSYYEKDAAQIIRTVCSAVEHLHKNGVVHRDLKPENLLFRTTAEDADLLIADFGLARIIDSEAFHILTTTCGTPGYMAPEIFKRSGHGKPVDMWAIGVVAYFLMCGYTPFDEEDSADERNAIMHGDYDFDDEWWKGISSEAKDFINHLLVVDPQGRMTATQALQHPWLVYHAEDREQKEEKDLLPNITNNYNFNPRRTLKRTINLVGATVSLARGIYHDGIDLEQWKPVPETDPMQVFHRQ